MKWVLIVFMYFHDGASSFAHDFETKEACMSALEQSKKSYIYEYGFCTEKGSNQ